MNDVNLLRKRLGVLLFLVYITVLFSGCSNELENENQRLTNENARLVLSIKQISTSANKSKEQLLVENSRLNEVVKNLQVNVASLNENLHTKEKANTELRDIKEKLKVDLEKSAYTLTQSKRDQITEEAEKKYQDYYMNLLISFGLVFIIVLGAMIGVIINSRKEEKTLKSKLEHSTTTLETLKGEKEELEQNKKIENQNLLNEIEKLKSTLKASAKNQVVTMIEEYKDKRALEIKRTKV